MTKGLELFSTKEVSKRYPSVKALEKVNIRGSSGEVLAICGANGAGKSTFARVLAGVERPTDGSLSVRGEQVDFRSPAEAESRGVLLMHQEPLIVDDLTVAENLWLHKLRSRGLARPPSGQDRQSQTALAAVDLGDVDPSGLAGSLSTAQRQMLALARAHIIDHQILILDETTASMTASHFETVVDFVNESREAGKCIVIVSHKLDEIFRVASRIIVLRDGREVGDLEASATSIAEVSDLMAGSAVRAVRNSAERLPPETSQVLFEAKGVSAGGANNVSLTVHYGEVVGIYGLIGSGRSSFARGISGQLPRRSGTLHVRGRKTKIKSPVQALRAGVGYVSEDRKHEGFIPEFSNKQNVTLGSMRQVSAFGVISPAKERRLAQQVTKDYAIKGGPEVMTDTLSGGNQQKVCVAGRITSGADVLVFDEPSKGVDVSAKQKIYEIILDGAANKKGVVVVSSEEEEILAVSSRIIVFRNGKAVAEFDDVSRVSRADLIHAALGSDH